MCPLAGIEPAALRFQCTAPINWAYKVQLSSSDNMFLYIYKPWGYILS
jgi:hypothetical protein